MAKEKEKKPDSKEVQAILVKMLSMGEGYATKEFVERHFNKLKEKFGKE